MTMQTSVSLANAPAAGIFLRNAWYVAGFAEELNASGLFTRRILNEPVLLFREADGALAALTDRCPHRLVPLSRGRLTPEGVQCGYHGLTFGSKGQCTLNPHGPAAALSVRSYPIIESQGIIWIWMGSPDLAASVPLPSFERLDEASFHVRHGYLHGRANYELMTDNILDLSHIEFLHPALGTQAVRAAKVEVTQAGNRVQTTRRMMGEILPPGLAKVYDVIDKCVNRTMTVTWQAPSNLVLQVAIEPVDGEDDRPLGSQSLHLFTPETATTTHYFFVSSLDRTIADEATMDAFQPALIQAFANEDKPMIDAQAELLGEADIMSFKPALLAIDKGPVLARRTLTRLIAEESA